MNPINIGILIPIAQALLIGAFAWSLLNCLREEETLTGAFEGLVVGLLALAFYRQGADVLSGVSKSLVEFMTRNGGGVGIKERLLAALAANHQDTQAIANGSGVSPIAAFKTGLWGALVTISQFAFICMEGVIELAQRVFWQLLLILFPIAAGLYPVLPGMMMSLVLYAVELSLWIPILYIINFAAGATISSDEIANSALGLGVVITELLTVFLILNVPSVTHRFMRGAFDHLLGVGGPAWGFGKRAGGYGYNKGEKYIRDGVAHGAATAAAGARGLGDGLGSKS